MAPDAPVVGPTDGADCLTSDGRVVTIRPARPSDADALVALHDRSSDETRYFRFFSVHPQLSEEDAVHFVTVDHLDREALVVVERGELVGLGGYDRSEDPTRAEVAFLIDDAHQHRGLGSLLLEHLSVLARGRGVHRLVASVLATNHLMLEVFSRAGFTQERTFDYGIVELVLDIDDLATARETMDRRERVSDIASMRPILAPSRIAVVTGRPQDDPTGWSLARRCAASFAGPVHAVNPDGVAAGGASGHRSIDELPAGVDLAIVTTPPEDLPGALDACGAREIRGCVVITPVAHHDEVMALRTRARAAGIRLVGPGSGGLLDRHRGLDALLGAEPGRPGPVGVLTQSSSTARYLAAALDDVGVGVASVVTLGAKADVSGNDLLQAWADDPRVRVAVLQLESLGNPHRFVRIVRRVGRDMPVVLLRVGELLDHIPASDAALLSQLGLIDVTSMDEAAEVAALLTDPALAGTAAVAREKVAAYAEWARRPGTIAVPPTPPDRLTARTVLWSERPQAEARWIDPDGAAAVLAAYGIGVAPPDGDAGPAGAGEIRVEVTAHPQLGAILSVEASDRRDGPLRRILPLDDEGLDELVTEAAGAASRHERGALADLLLRLTLLVIDDRELVEIRLDAIDAATTPATVVGAHLRVAPPPGAWDDDVRHLRRDHP